jgi:hypothetical protein
MIMLLCSWRAGFTHYHPLACGSKVLYHSLLLVFARRAKTSSEKIERTALPKAKMGFACHRHKCAVDQGGSIEPVQTETSRASALAHDVRLQQLKMLYTLRRP